MGAEHAVLVLKNMPTPLGDMPEIVLETWRNRRSVFFAPIAARELRSPCR